jgi:protein-disulfide isomerase
MRDPRAPAKVQQDMAEGTVAGVRVPPAVFVNGRLVRKTTPEDIEASIEKEVKKLGG